MEREIQFEAIELPNVRSLDIELPDLSPPTQEEIVRRRAIFEATMALRVNGEPPTPGNSIDDYLRQMRAEEDTL
ncbi:MAG TPA: hypothetical protein VHL09_06490 [Dehalococcoidia bacterium]|nr:hypothetical protein [Dehalococcoidia bacterium]